MIISLDTECTGLDFPHGAMPFVVTTCRDDVPPEEAVSFWEWPVDPLTRQPEIPREDIESIAELLDAAELIYLQNSKYDARALKRIGIALPWEKVRDTLCMGHLLASNHPHDLTWMCIQYLGADIEPFELKVKQVVKECRAIVKKDYPEWKIAREGDEGMPSVKDSSKRDEDKPWKNDMWLPKALAKQWDAEGRPLEDASWIDAVTSYANADSSHTLPLGIEMERIIAQRGLWAIYQESMKKCKIACEMEEYGVTVIGSYTEATIGEYEEYVAEAEQALVGIASGYGHDLELAKGAALNDNMRDFFYGSILQKCPRCDYEKRVKHWNGESVNGDVCPKCLKRKRSPMRHQLTTTHRENLALPVIHGKKTGNASLDKDAMQEYIQTLDGSAFDFINILTGKRKHDTDLTYMRSYRRFWVPVVDDFYRIHGHLNPFATDHLRWASNSPNMQNVGQQEDQCEDCDGEGCVVCGFTGKSRLSVRNCFGPAPGREWYTADYNSIERRLPVFESGEPKMMEVFNNGDQPPYWANGYNLTASALYPDEYWPVAEVKGAFRKNYPKLYKQAKFFDLAKQYGCGPRKGDLLSKVNGSFQLMDNEFPLFAKLQAHYLAQAEKLGYVETIPDKSVDPKRGYPILASRTDDGRVLSTTPFNYHVSGTACWCKNRALARCSEQLEHWRSEGFDAHIALEIHDEILFDFPKGRTPEENIPRALVLRALMEKSGEDIGIPTPVSVEYHDTTWAKGTAI